MYFLFFKSQLKNRSFVTEIGSEFSNLFLILVAVPQNAISYSILYNINAAGQPTFIHISLDELTEDEIIFTSHKRPFIDT